MHRPLISTPRTELRIAVTITTIDELQLRVLDSGRLPPWIGPALRGVLALSLKERVCLHPPRERRERWVHCTGCPLQSECAYGPLFEPELPAGVLVRKGHEDIPRPVVLAPYYPLGDFVAAGQEIPLRIKLIGDNANARWPHLFSALDVAGTKGLHQVRAATQSSPAAPVRFEISGTQRVSTTHVAPADLPAAPNDLPGAYPRVAVKFTSPLALMKRQNGDAKRTLVKTPSFADLFQASWSILSAFFRIEGQTLPRTYRAWMERAAVVPRRDEVLDSVRQVRRSTRSQQSFDIGAIEGGAIYGSVPAGFIPYLYWGGQLHVGADRVMGAGGWQLIVD